MSTQSGITASPELLTAFQNLTTNYLIIKINPESTFLIVDDKAPSVADKATDEVFTSLQQYIESIHPHPVYIILNVEGQLSFISFIPDIAHIRDKMLYASTKNTILQELGTNKFQKDQIFNWSELDELTMRNFEACKPNAKEFQELGDDELIKQIDNLQDVKINDNRGVFNKKLASMDSNQLLFKFSPDLSSCLESDNDLIIFNIDNNETFQLLDKRPSVDIDSLISTIDTTNREIVTPKFSLFKYFESEYALIYSCPSGSKVRDRMIYASNKQGLVNYLKNKFTISKVIEVGDIEELDLGELVHESKKEVKVEKNLKFNKPKGPRRR